MAKSISCKDVGMNCDFTAIAETTEELLKGTAAHAKEAHRLDSIAAELMQWCRPPFAMSSPASAELDKRMLHPVKQRVGHKFRDCAAAILCYGAAP